jgi:AGZA family xanthine/uracil permease-like MFS transporter
LVAFLAEADMMRYHWVRGGDFNAFFGLMLDNVAVMVLFVNLICYAPGHFDENKFDPVFVMTHMIPGTALGVLFGDLVYTVMAFRLARRTGNPDVTAMPLGLDTPSTIGIPLLVLLPALAEANGLFPGDHARAMEFAWHVGLLVLVLSGVFKVICAPFGNAVRRLVPRAGLLGSLAAIALALIAFLPLLDVAATPAAGLPALAVILVTLVAHRELPGRIPGALAAVLVGVAAYQLVRLIQPPLAGPAPPPAPGGSTAAGGLVLPSLAAGAGWWEKVFLAALAKLPVALPFALATVVGGIDCTESAAAVGDEFDTRAVLLTEGLAALLAGLLGGVIQTTPYIGHPAYKKMGGRAAYTLATALFVGAAGTLGGFGLLFEWLPREAMFPILVFVGLEITAQSFHATPPRHYPAVALAMMPALAALVIIAANTMFGPQVPATDVGRGMLQTLRCLASGFIVTSLLWAAGLAVLLEGRPGTAAAYFAVAGACALFGVIHSPLPAERIDLPGRVWAQVPEPFQAAAQYQTPYHWAAAYAVVALLLAGLTLARPGGAPSAAPLPAPDVMGGRGAHDAELLPPQPEGGR